LWSVGAPSVGRARRHAGDAGNEVQP